jgi:sarcosine oxidase subunit beta
MMEIAYDRWSTLASEINHETGYERTGHLLLFEQQTGGGVTGGFASASARHWLQNQKGVNTERPDAERVHEMEPYLSDEVIGALYCPNDGIADHTATTRGLAKAAEREGADIHEHIAAVDLVTNGSTVEAVITENGEKFVADKHVIMLSNVHTARFVEDQFDMTVPVWGIFPQVVNTEPLDEVPVKHLIGHDSRTLALKEVEGNRVMISGGWRGRWDPELERWGTDPDQVKANVREAIATYPTLEELTIEKADAGRQEGSCIDHVPIIGELPGIEGLIIGTGWTGHGFAISLAVNQLLAEWMLEGQKPKLLEPFAYERFIQ